MTRVLFLAVSTALITLTLPVRPLLAQGREAAVVQRAAAVLQEIQAMPGRNIPQGLLAKARAVAIVPNVIKIGFIAAGRHGAGVAVVRNPDGTWGNPIFVSLTGGGLGFQAGVQSTDVVLVFNSSESVQGMLNGKFTLGADAAVAAGPVGRQAAAATDIQLRAEILSYSRSRGLFAGVSLDGSVLSVDHNANASFYHVVGGTPQAIIAGQGVPVPPAAAELKTALARYSGPPSVGTVAAVEMTAPQQTVPAARAMPAQTPGQVPMTGPGPAAMQAPAATPDRVPAATAGTAPAPAPLVASGLAPQSNPTPAPVQPSTPAATSGADQIRRNLAGAAQQLGARLDQPWRNYLALPSAVFADNQKQPTPEALRLSLDHFDRVQRDPQYRMVSGMTEFQTTLGLLHKYYYVLTQPAPPTSTPPPPPTETGSGARSELR